MSGSGSAYPRHYNPFDGPWWSIWHAPRQTIRSMLSRNDPIQAIFPILYGGLHIMLGLRAFIAVIGVPFGEGGTDPTLRSGVEFVETMQLALIAVPVFLAVLFVAFRFAGLRHSEATWRRTFIAFGWVLAPQFVFLAWYFFQAKTSGILGLFGALPEMIKHIESFPPPVIAKVVLLILVTLPYLLWPVHTVYLLVIAAQEVRRKSVVDDAQSPPWHEQTGPEVRLLWLRVLFTPGRVAAALRTGALKPIFPFLFGWALAFGDEKIIDQIKANYITGMSPWETCLLMTVASVWLGMFTKLWISGGALHWLLRKMGGVGEFAATRSALMMSYLPLALIVIPSSIFLLSIDVPTLLETYSMQEMNWLIRTVSWMVIVVLVVRLFYRSVLLKNLHGISYFKVVPVLFVFESLIYIGLLSFLDLGFVNSLMI